MRIFVCKKCGKIVEMLHKSPCPTMCCGEPMEEAAANTSDGALEKHVPVVEIKDGVVNVCVGEAVHPMLDAHYIMWIALETTNGIQRKPLAPGEEPKAAFALLPEEKPIAAYEYCNLHGLWKKEI